MKNARLTTPPLWTGVLDGVTRGAILRVAREQGLETMEEPLTMHDLYTSDECFATATRLEIVPIVWVDGRRIGDGAPGPITNKIQRGFKDLVNREGTAIYGRQVPRKSRLVGGVKGHN